MQFFANIWRATTERKYPFKFHGGWIGHAILRKRASGKRQWQANTRYQ